MKIATLISAIVFLVIFLSILMLAAWVFWLTRSPWSFLILVLAFGMSFSTRNKD